jgi:hypothetical protein
MRIDEKITFFFAPPVPRQPTGQMSTLHLARREAQDCLIGTCLPERDVLGQPERHRLFATAMVIMAAVDLLAKFYAGRDGIGESGARVKDFLKEFLLAGNPRADEFAEAIYLGVRNPLLHSFSLHSTARTVALAGGPGLGSREVVWWNRERPEELMISVDGLFAAFVQAVSDFEGAIRADAGLQRNFELMFEPYGVLAVGYVS